jgi:hypothetical protein
MNSPEKNPPTHQAISGRARTLWEAAGRPEGEDMNHWLQAERELNREFTDSDGTYSGTSDIRDLESVASKRARSRTPFKGASEESPRSKPVRKRP